MFLGLRKFSGVSRIEFMERFGNSMDEIYAEVIQELIEEGLLTTTSDGYVLTHQGKFLGNNVFQSFLIDEDQNEIWWKQGVLLNISKECGIILYGILNAKNKTKEKGISIQWKISLRS